MSTSMRTLLFAIAAISLAAPATAENLSTSVLRPTAIDPTSGRVSGMFPGGEGSTSYYLTVDLQPGDLITQLQVSGRPNSAKRVDFELLAADGRVSVSS